MSALAQLPPDLIAMMARGVSVIVGSHDAALVPSLMRAVGSELSADRRSVTVYLARRQSRQLLADIQATGQLAVVFSEPASHRTVQLKTRKVSLRDATEQDTPVLARYLASMEVEIGRVGHSPEIVRAMLAHRAGEVVAVSFEPEQAFDQTPGPRAGEPIGPAP